MARVTPYVAWREASVSKNGDKTGFKNQGTANRLVYKAMCALFTLKVL